MFVANRFLLTVVKDYGKCPVSTEIEALGPPQSCSFLNIVHNTHFPFEKSIIIERTMQYIKDRTESFDDYFPCRKKRCKLKHVLNWL